MKKARILVVEDRRDVLTAIESSNMSPFDLRVVSTKDIACEAAADWSPEVVLVNTGLCTVEDLNVDPSVPVAVLIERTNLDSVEALMDAGAAEFIGTPLIPKLFESRVHTLVILARRYREERELMHMLCHDLSNPFENILDLLSVLEKDATQTAEYIPLLEESALNGKQVIELLRGSRVLEDRSIDLSPVSVQESVAQSERILSYLLAKKKLSMDVSIDQNLFVLAERISLVNFVLNNVLSNAVKYSHPNSVISVKGRARGSNVLISIRDTGIGIPEEIMATLFTGGSASVRTGTAGETGVGYGMARARRYVDYFGGTMEVKSRTNGSTSQVDAPNSAGTSGTEVVLTLQPAE